MRVVSGEGDEYGKQFHLASQSLSILRCFVWHLHFPWYSRERSPAVCVKRSFFHMRSCPFISTRLSHGSVTTYW